LQSCFWKSYVEWNLSFVSPCIIREGVEKPKIVRSSLTIDNDLGTKCLTVEVQWGLPPFFKVGRGRAGQEGGGVTLFFEGMATRMVAPVLKPKNNINRNVCLSSPTYAAQEALQSFLSGLQIRRMITCKY